MTDPNRPSDDAVKPAQTGEPVVSKPYIMPDDPEEGSNEAADQGTGRSRATRCCARWRKWKTCASAPPRGRRFASAYGITGFARDILDIADNLQRALDAIPAEAKETADPGIKAFIEGVELTERSLLNTLEKNGVKKFDPSGEKFDPELPAGDVRSARSVRSVRDGGSGRAGRLHDRRARAAPGAGRRLQGRREGRAGGELKFSALPATNFSTVSYAIAYEDLSETQTTARARFRQ